MKYLVKKTDFRKYKQFILFNRFPNLTHPPIFMGQNCQMRPQAETKYAWYWHQSEADCWRRQIWPLKGAGERGRRPRHTHTHRPASFLDTQTIKIIVDANDNLYKYRYYHRFLFWQFQYCFENNIWFRVVFLRFIVSFKSS